MPVKDSRAESSSQPRQESDSARSLLHWLLGTAHLRPGDRLPPERELQRAIRSSRNEVRSALGLLESQGLVERRSGHKYLAGSATDIEGVMVGNVYGSGRVMATHKDLIALAVLTDLGVSVDEIKEFERHARSRSAPVHETSNVDLDVKALETESGVSTARSALLVALEALNHVAAELPERAEGHHPAADHLRLYAFDPRNRTPTRPTESLAAFAGTLEELGVTVDAATARRAALIAASDQIWENELGPLWESARVSQLLTVSRQRINELTRAHRLIVLRNSSGRLLYPAFQFVDGRPARALIEAFYSVSAGAASEWTAASWCVAPDVALDGLSPLEWVKGGRDVDRLLEVAGRDSARFAR